MDGSNEAQREKILASREGRIKDKQEERIQMVEPRIQLSGPPPSTKHSTTLVLHAIPSLSSQSHGVDLPAHSNYYAAFILQNAHSRIHVTHQWKPQEVGRNEERNHSGVQDTKENVEYMRESRLRRVWEWR